MAQRILSVGEAQSLAYKCGYLKARCAQLDGDLNDVPARLGLAAQRRGRASQRDKGAISAPVGVRQ